MHSVPRRRPRPPRRGARFPAKRDAVAAPAQQVVVKARSLWLRAVPPVLLACALAMIPWIIYLGLSLPARSTIQHYRLFWVGLDIAITLALICTAVLALQHREGARSAAVVAATLLGTDVWLDVTSSGPGWPLLYALARAAIIELPGALLLLWVFRWRGPGHQAVPRWKSRKAVAPRVRSLADSWRRNVRPRLDWRRRNEFVAVEAQEQRRVNGGKGSHQA